MPSSSRHIISSSRRTAPTSHASPSRARRYGSDGVLAVPHAKAFAPLNTFLVAHRLDPLISAFFVTLYALRRPRGQKNKNQAQPAAPSPHLKSPKLSCGEHLGRQ